MTLDNNLCNLTKIPVLAFRLSVRYLQNLYMQRLFWLLAHILFMVILMEEKTDEIGLPLIGEKAPDFEAATTQGTLRLSDFEGIWLVLFSRIYNSP